MDNKPATSADPDVEANKTAAALAYLWILAIVILLLKKNSPFAHYHAKQGTLLFAIEIILMFVVFIPFINFIWFLIFILAAFGIYHALDGSRKPLPVIGKYAEKINI